VVNCVVFFGVEKHATFCEFFKETMPLRGEGSFDKKAAFQSVSLRPLVEQTLHRRLIGLRFFGIQERHCDLFVRENPEQMDWWPFAV
jgi:hypothetical protein